MSIAASLARAVTLLGLFSSAGGADLVLRSGPAPVALIELFTSEGCSSCPPAEKWLGTLRDDTGLWTQFVPVAFHVNYWDHLGWRDALASKDFTAREYAYAAAWGAASVYTPCFVRNGEEWRPRGPAPVTAPPAGDAGLLTLTWQAAPGQARIDYVPPAGTKPAAAFSVSLALLGSGLVSHVAKGENAGRRLQHEFVALRLASAALRRDAAGGWSAQVSLAPRADVGATRRALAA